MTDRQPQNEKQEAAGQEKYAQGNVRFFSHSTQVFKHHVPTEYILLAIVEAAALFISFYAGIELRFSGVLWEHRALPSLTSSGITYSIIMLSSLVAFGASQRTAQTSISLLAVRVAGSLMLGLVVISLTYSIAPTLFLGRGALGLAVLVSFVSILGVRIIFMRITDAYDMRIRLLVLGDGKAAGLIKEEARAGNLGGVNVLTYMPMPGDIEDSKSIGLVQTPGALVKYVADQRADVIVLALDDRRKGLPVHELLDCKMGGVQVIDLLTFFERYTNKVRLDIMQPSWLFLSDGFAVSNFRKTWKRILDVACVLLLVPIVAPIVLLSILAILVESRGRGPIF